MRKFHLFSILILCAIQTVSAQTIDDLFQARTQLSRDYRQVAAKYQSLEINPARLTTLRQQGSTTLRLQLPFEQRQLNLDLHKVKITTENFSVIEALPNGGRRTVDYSGAVFYQGKIEGVPGSFASISIVNDQVIGVIADDKSNIVLGAIENNGRATQEYVLYREPDLQVANPMNCFTSDVPIDGTANYSNPNARPNAVGEPVEIYFECDYKFFLDKGSSTVNVINYVLGFFNNTALLYANEDVKLQVSQILVWTTQDPEAASGLTTTSTCLVSFRDRMVATDYIGDYAHLLSTRSLGGGIAYILSNPCNSSKQFRSAVSAINNSYNNFPTYTWTVQVVTHELGHNLGSNHTQWCGWVGGALDNCYTTEVGCLQGPPPVNGGTIMSYCHLTSNGINFSNGFGAQPGDRIRAVVSNSACFGNCRMTIEVTKQDASCGQNNGSATVVATNGTGTITYTWSNGQTGATLINAGPGTYHVTVKDGISCQVMQVVTIGNSGSTLTFAMTPNGTAGFCSGGNLLLSATANPGYAYVWKKDGNTISGATTSNYNVTVPGTYSVTATSGICSGTQSVVVSILPPPTATVNAGGPTVFCGGNNVLLNGNAGGSYTYQWYSNGIAIAGATGPTYSATNTGDYTLKISAGSTCEATSAPVSVIVKAAPASGLIATGLTSFCAGNSVALSSVTGTGYTYEWNRNGVLIPGASQPNYSAMESGIYTVVTAIGPCSKTSSGIPVLVWANPVVTILPAVSTIQKFQTQTLTATGAPSYNWADQPAMVSSSTNSAVYKPLTTTQYTLQGIDVNGCKGTATATITVIGCGEVTNITETPYSPSRVIVRWKNPDGATTDTLQYRKVGSTAWISVYVSGEEYELNGLVPGTDYEYNIIPLCTTTTVFIASATKTFRTGVLNGGLYIRLYPNPVSLNAKLEIISSENIKLQISLFDNTGRVVKYVSPVENFPPGQVVKTIDIGNLPNGIYLLSIGINGKVHHEKMVVAR
ncbi:MAG: T9SS type A sorting domain-containing protein [Chitinophagaceae bacterium]|nr:T9SS type A sorting domain-containing protein [Chitinophagaceae bacterium]